MIKEGSKVTVNYVGTFKNGVEFDKGEFTFEIGAKQVIPGFEENIKKMKQGDEKTFELEPKDAYGEVNENMIQEIPKEAIERIKKPGVKLEVGKTLALMAPNGQVFPVLIKAITKTGYVMDMNHPLAGKTLCFKVKVIKVE